VTKSWGCQTPQGSLMPTLWWTIWKTPRMIAGIDCNMWIMKLVTLERFLYNKGVWGIFMSLYFQCFYYMKHEMAVFFLMKCYLQCNLKPWLLWRKLSTVKWKNEFFFGCEMSSRTMMWKPNDNCNMCKINISSSGLSPSWRGKPDVHVTPYF